MIKNAFTLLRQLQQSRNVRFLRKINLGILLWALYTDLTGVLWCFISIWGSKQESWWIPFNNYSESHSFVSEEFRQFFTSETCKITFWFGIRISNDRTKLIHRFLPMNSLQDHWFMTIFTPRKKIHTSFKPRKNLNQRCILMCFENREKFRVLKNDTSLFELE